MKQDTLSDLKAVAEALFQQQYQTLRPVLDAEARLQRGLAKLDAQMRQARQESAQTDGYTITGTDVLWRGWEASTRRQLNMELARTRAQKLAALDALRHAFGRKQALETLSNSLQQDPRRGLS